MILRTYAGSRVFVEWWNVRLLFAVALGWARRFGWPW
jgi:hypothetical protein